MALNNSFLDSVRKVKQHYADYYAPYVAEFIFGFLAPGAPAFVAAFFWGLMAPATVGVAMTIGAVVFGVASVFCGLVYVLNKYFNSFLEANHENVKNARQVINALDEEIQQRLKEMQEFMLYELKLRVVVDQHHDNNNQFIKLMEDQLIHAKKSGTIPPKFSLQQYDELCETINELKSKINHIQTEHQSLQDSWTRRRVFNLLWGAAITVAQMGLPVFILLTVNAVVLPITSFAMVNAWVGLCALWGMYQGFNIVNAKFAADASYESDFTQLTGQLTPMLEASTAQLNQEYQTFENFNLLLAAHTGEHAVVPKREIMESKSRYTQEAIREVLKKDDFSEALRDAVASLRARGFITRCNRKQEEFISHHPYSDFDYPDSPVNRL